MSDVLVVHERVTDLAGSEKVVEQLLVAFPGARLFAPVVDPTVDLAVPSGTDVDHSWLQKLYPGGGTYAHLLPLLPLAMRRAPVRDARVVITSHHAFANRVRVPEDVAVVSYTHTTPRWMWDAAFRQGELGGRLGAALLGAFSATQRRGDRSAGRRASVVVVNSTTVAERVRRYWGRDDSIVVHPPVDVDFYHPDAGVEREDFFLLAGRLVPYKRPEVAVEAARRAGVRLVVAGDGRMKEQLEASAGDSVTFLGRVGDDELRELFRRCRALLFPGVEDFGIVPVEAQACGAPVLAIDDGGARDSVVDGTTGWLVPDDGRLAEGFASRLATWDDRFDSAAIRRHAERFSAERFRGQMQAIVAPLSSAGAV
jgi:glycosyltransferase involved in cell wall biosynthesis